eukprot:1504933-Heterocapsa_arctica.AAC.1
MLEPDDTAVWADVSWISRFPEEAEILFAPCIFTRQENALVHAVNDETGLNCIEARFMLSAAMWQP